MKKIVIAIVLMFSLNCMADGPSRTISITNQSKEGVDVKDSSGHIVTVNSDRSAFMDITVAEPRGSLPQVTTISVYDKKGFIGMIKIGEQTKNITIHKDLTLSVD